MKIVTKLNITLEKCSFVKYFKFWIICDILINMKKVSDLWFKIDDKIRFLLIGGLNAGISYIIFVILILMLGESMHGICVTGQWVLSSFMSYLNQKFFVFCTKGNYVKEYLKCCSTWVVSYVLNLIILEIFVRYLIKNIYIAQFISLFIVSVVTYLLFKYFAFRGKRNKEN